MHTHCFRMKLKISTFSNIAQIKHGLISIGVFYTDQHQYLNTHTGSKHALKNVCPLNSINLKASS